MHGSRVLLSVGLAFGLAIPGSAAMEPQVVVHPAAVASVAGSTVAQVTARKPVAVVSAVFETAADGKVVVEVTSNAKKVQVKYRNAKGRTKVVTRKLRAGSVVVLLPKGATRIKVRALGTPNLGRSPWARAKPKPHDPPAVVTPPSSPPPSSPPPSSPPPSSPPPSSPPPVTPPVIPAAVTRISTDSANNQVMGSSSFPLCSPNGTRVMFASAANGLVPGDTDGKWDVFIKTPGSGAISRLTNAELPYRDDGLAWRWSPDGTRVAFSTTAALAAEDTNALPDVYVMDVANGATQLVSGDAGGMVGNFASVSPVAWSPDGTKVAFATLATNLVDGWTDTNGVFDVVVKSLADKGVTLLSKGLQGSQAQGASEGPVWSPDGTRIAFLSEAPNLVDGDRNGLKDIFVADLGGSATRVNVDASGTELSGTSRDPVWSPDSTRIAFASSSDDLPDANGATQVYVKDLTGPIVMVSRATNGIPGAGPSLWPVWSSDGKRIAYHSYASNLVTNDVNQVPDVFVTTLESGTTMRAGGSTEPNGQSMWPSWCPTSGGDVLTFASAASNLVVDDTNNAQDIFRQVLGQP